VENKLSLIERLTALTKHIPAFQNPAIPPGEWIEPAVEPGYISMPSFVSNDDTESFLSDCYESGWILSDFAWPAWAQSEEAQTLRDDSVALAHATEHQLAQLLTTVIRQDRFAEGTLASACESGLILGILRRAEALKVEKILIHR